MMSPLKSLADGRNIKKMGIGEIMRRKMWPYQVLGTMRIFKWSCFEGS